MDYADNEVIKQELELFIMINEVLEEEKKRKHPKTNSLYGNFYGYSPDAAERGEKREEALLSSLKARATE